MIQNSNVIGDSSIYLLHVNFERAENILNFCKHLLIFHIHF